MMPQGYKWGHNLWHSTAIELMDPQEIVRLFGHRSVLTFDEMMQHGREMNELRSRLSAKDIEAKVTSLVCVRRRSHAESGDLLEYKAYACEDVDDKIFAERAISISRLVHLFEPPLDADHIVVKGYLSKEISDEDFFKRLAKWGMPFIVWSQDKEHKFMAVTLDRPQFFDIGNSVQTENLSYGWEGPCKVRFYLSPESGECFCSFIVYPQINAQLGDWAQLSLDGNITKQLPLLINMKDNAQTNLLESSLRRVYQMICVNMGLKLFDNFVVSGAMEEIGITIDTSPNAIDLDQTRATFGRTFGDMVIKKMRDTIIHASTGKRDMFHEGSYSPPPLFVRQNRSDKRIIDTFKCRVDLLKAIPKRYDDESKNGPNLPISYGGIVTKLGNYLESTIGRVFDYELDQGTIKPFVQVDLTPKNGTYVVNIWRGFYRGEFGAWFEWDRLQTHQDVVIQRTLGLGPTMIEQFMAKTGDSQMTATHFDKLFANIQHDLREGIHDLFYIGWRPYKYGPVPIVSDTDASGSYVEFQRFLIDRNCISEVRERHGSVVWHRYKPADENIVQWRNLYQSKISAVTRAHLAGLVRLYAAILKRYKTIKSAEPNSSTGTTVQDPLIMLASARNEKIAYICGWFEVHDWKAKGRLFFPYLTAIASTERRHTDPFLKSELEDFAAPGRLLLNKIEMYRNIPYLRQQIDNMVQTDDFEAGIVALDTIDVTPKFDMHSAYPMGKLEWACGIMRAFSSMTRQILTACNLDIETESEGTKGNKVNKDSSYYLEKLLTQLPDLRPLEGKLRFCISESKNGILTLNMAECLSNTFSMILSIFDNQVIPDPRPTYERRKEKQQIWDGLLITFKEVQLTPPYAIAVADIKNIRNLPKYGEIFGITQGHALNNLQDWVERIVNKVVERHRSEGVVLAGLTGDNVILASPTCEGTFISLLDLIRQMNYELAVIDRTLFASFGLLRAGISWREDSLSSDYADIRPGVIAYEIGDKHGRGLGEIAISEAIYQRLPNNNQVDFIPTDEVTGQGKVFLRKWNPDRDSTQI
jgi:hypothetical protein